jgi:integrase
VIAYTPPPVYPSPSSIVNASAPNGGDAPQGDHDEANTTSQRTAKPQDKGRTVGDDRDDLTTHAETVDARERELEQRIEELEAKLEDQQRLEEKIDELTSMLARVEHADREPSLFREWSYEDLEAYTASRPSTGASTARKYRGKLERLEDHDEHPVSLHPPDQDAWRRHIVFRKNAGQGGTLNIQRAALLVLFEWLEEETGVALRWATLEHTFSAERDPITLPPEDLVPEFWQHTYFPRDRTKTKLAQYLMRFCFLAGPRPPSEPAVLPTDGVKLDTRELQIHQPKKGGRINYRPQQPAHLMTASNAKSLRLWIEDWRPRLEPNTDALFPDFRGEPWPSQAANDPYNRLGCWLRERGTDVWEGFHPYCARHWYATTMMRQCRDVHLVADELGDTVQVVDDRYVDRARARDAIDADWTAPPLGYQGGHDGR